MNLVKATRLTTEERRSLRALLDDLDQQVKSKK
jgi:hypothetical protein